MTVSLNSEEVAKRISDTLPDSITAFGKEAIVTDSQSLYKIAEFLKNTPGFDFDYLTILTAVDYADYFEIVYYLTSLKHNHDLVLKARCYDKENPVMPSVMNLWRTADLQEREVYDLMGITFEGHPNMKRLLLWENFEGHPLRKDYL